MKLLRGIAIRLMMITIVIFAGCQGDGGTKNGESENTEKEVIKIGAILPLTGNASVTGVYSKNGLKLAVNELNEAGGIGNKMIELEIKDSKGLAKEGVSILQKMNASENPPTLVYSQLSSVSLAVKPIAEQKQQFLFAVSGANDLLNDAEYTYRNYVDPTILGNSIVRLLHDSLEVKELGVLYSNNDFGLSINNAISAQLSELGVERSFSEPFNEQQDDYRTLIQKVLAHDPNNIYIVGIGKSLGIIIKQLREGGYEGEIFGGLETPFPDVLAIAGIHANGIRYIDFAFDNQSSYKATQLFVEKYQNKFNELPQTPSAIAYDAIMLFAKAFDGREDDLNNVDVYNGIFGPVRINNNNIIYQMQIKTIEN